MFLHRVCIAYASIFFKIGRSKFDVKNNLFGKMGHYLKKIYISGCLHSKRLNMIRDQ